jgi:hypothetical protein
METLIKLLESEIKVNRDDSHSEGIDSETSLELTAYADGIQKAIDIIRENMPLTVSEVVEYLKNDNATIRMIISEEESGHFSNTDIGFRNIEQLTKIIRNK